MGTINRLHAHSLKSGRVLAPHSDSCPLEVIMWGRGLHIGPIIIGFFRNMWWMYVFGVPFGDHRIESDGMSPDS